MLPPYRRSWQSGDANRICPLRGQLRTLSFAKLGLATQFAPQGSLFRRDQLEKTGSDSSCTIFARNLTSGFSPSSF